MQFDRPIRDLLITAVEVNGHHGVGILLHRMFGSGVEFVCLRSATMYGGNETFGTAHRELKSRSLRLAEVELRLREILKEFKIRRILCVPYYREDFIHAVLAKRICGVPLCTYLMDDQNIFAPQVPDRWVRLLLEQSDLRLGISQELCISYEAKFGQQFFLLPPLVESASGLVPCYWQVDVSGAQRCAMIGNLWSQTRLVEVIKLISSTGFTVDWYGNGPEAKWLDGTRKEWERNGLNCCGFLPEEDLVAALASYPFILIPSGSADENDDNPAFSRLSLPSRLLFLHVRTDTPVLILGSAESAAGNFVRRLGTGLVSAAEAASFTNTAKQLCDMGVRARIREAIRKNSSYLVLSNGGDWIWQSLARKSPISVPFAAAFPTVDEDRYQKIVAAIPRPELRPAETSKGGFNPLRFRYSKNSMVHELRSSGLLNDIAIPDLELTEFIAAVTVQQILHLAPDNANVLFIGDTVPDAWRRHRRNLNAWCLGNFSDWRSAVERDYPANIVSAQTSGCTRHPPARFDIIASAGTGSLFSQTTDACARFAMFCQASIADRGWNVHVFSAVLQAEFRWVHPLHGYLVSRFNPDQNGSCWDELLTDEDTFFMSGETYERCWMPTTGKSWAEFGSPLWLGLSWQNRVKI